MTTTSMRPGDSITVADIIENVALGTAPASTTHYYLSKDTVRNTGDILLTGSRATPSLPPGLTSSGGATVKVPTTTPLGGYHVLACADDTKAIVELDETNNCVSTVSLVQVALPDLVTMTVSPSVASIQRGHSFSITDQVTNVGGADAGASTSRYYLSKDIVKGSDLLLSGVRKVPALVPGASSMGTVSVKVAATTTPGVYFLFACTDDLKVVHETSELDNCKLALSQITVTP